MQEFNMEIRDKQGKQHLITDHLSKLTFNEDDHNVQPILAIFLDVKLLVINTLLWVSDFAF